MREHFSDSVQSVNDVFFNYMDRGKKTKIKAAMRALEENKCLLMNALNRKSEEASREEDRGDFDKLKRLTLTDHEYNKLALITLATMNVESDFCSGWKYTVKEMPKVGQDLVDFRKKQLDRQGEENSRGCSQVKRPEAYIKKYLRPNEIKKLYVHDEHGHLYTLGLADQNIDYNLDRRKDVREFRNKLRLPELSVVVSFLAYYDQYSSNRDILKERYASDSDPRPLIDQVGDYLYYLYQNQISQLEKGLATPHVNLRVQKLMTSQKFFDIFVDVSPRAAKDRRAELIRLANEKQN